MIGVGVVKQQAFTAIVQFYYSLREPLFAQLFLTGCGSGAFIPELCAMTRSGGSLPIRSLVEEGPHIGYQSSMHTATIMMRFTVGIVAVQRPMKLFHVSGGLCSACDRRHAQITCPIMKHATTAIRHGYRTAQHMRMQEILTHSHDWCQISRLHRFVRMLCRYGGSHPPTWFHR